MPVTRVARPSCRALWCGRYSVIWVQWALLYLTDGERHLLGLAQHAAPFQAESACVQRTLWPSFSAARQAWPQAASLSSRRTSAAGALLWTRCALLLCLCSESTSERLSDLSMPAHDLSSLSHCCSPSMVQWSCSNAAALSPFTACTVIHSSLAVWAQDDSSLTRSNPYMLKLFEAANLRVLLNVQQRNFPKEIFKVRMYALQPRT